MIESDTVEVDRVNHQGLSSLHLAAAAPHSEQCLQLLINEGASVNLRAADGRTPIHMAAIHGRVSRTNILIAAGSELEATDKYGRTPLHVAAFFGHELLIGVLLSAGDLHNLSAGSDPKRKDFSGCTPIHMSATSGHLEACRKLAMAGAELDATDMYGRNCLHMSAFNGSIECLDFLISSGAECRSVDSLGKKTQMIMRAQFSIRVYSGRLPLHYAAAKCHYGSLYSLVSSGANVDHRDSEGVTCLHLVCALDMEGRCIEYLLGHKATPALADVRGYNALHYAAAAGNSAAVQHLLEFGGGDLFSKAGVEGVTPVHLAAYNGHRDVLVMLLSRFPSIDLADDLGRSALYLASYSGRSDCVTLLLERGALVTNNSSKCGLTPVHCASSQGHTETLKILLDNTEEASVVDTPDTSLAASPLMLAAYPGHRACVELLLEYGSNVRAVDICGRAAIMWAVLSGQEECVRRLLEATKDRLQQDRRGRNPHHVAAAHGQVIVLGALIENYPKEVSARDSDGYTPLHYAAYFGQEGTLDLLLQSEVTESRSDEVNTVTPLHCALVTGSEQCLQLLLANSTAQVNTADTVGHSPLHIAAARNLLNSTKLLISKGADVNTKNAKGQTPLMMAAVGGHTGIIEVLMEEHADTECVDSGGNTALHYACSRGMSRSANIFLRSASCDLVSVQNLKGKSALHLAAGRGLVETTELLLGAGASVTCVDSQVTHGKGVKQLLYVKTKGKWGLMNVKTRHGVDRVKP